MVWKIVTSLKKVEMIVQPSSNRNLRGKLTEVTSQYSFYNDFEIFIYEGFLMLLLYVITEKASMCCMQMSAAILAVK